MIELRWLVNNGEQVLQYRQQVDTTVRAGMWPAPDMARTANMQWSDWRDVPEVVENTSPFKGKCPKCGLAFIGTMSYTCTQVDCPTGLGSST
jgi:hypothetical protein